MPLRFSALVLFAISLQAAPIDPCQRGYRTLDYAVTTMSPGYTVGDFNEDGRADLLVTILYDHTYLLINRGPELFEPHDLGIVRDWAYSYYGIAADMNDDGHLDLVLFANSATRVRFGHGDGTFGPPIVSQFSNLYSGMFVDVDRNGRLDLVAVESNRTFVALSNADGTFGNGISQPLQQAWQWDHSPLARGDFDGDGHFDIVSLGFDWETQQAQAHILWGNGNLQFTSEKQTLPANLAWSGMHELDLEGDGVVELAKVEESTLTVVRGIGRKLTVEHIPLSERLDPSFAPLLAGDFDGDRKRDLVFKSNSAAALLWGREDGEQQFAISVFDFPGAPLEAADLDGDDVDDLLGASTDGIPVIHGRQGSRDLQAARLVAAAGIVTGLHAPDLNDDGRKDLIVSYRNSPHHSVSVYKGLSGGGFALRSNIDGERAVAAADLDRDGRLDLVTQTEADLPSTRVHFGSGWTFSDPLTLSTAGRYVGMATLIDGRRGVIVNESNALTFVGLTGRSKTSAVLFTNASSGLTAFTVDVDGDGDSELLMLDNAGNGSVYTQMAFGWGAAAIKLDIFNAEEVVSADVDRDGRIDLVVRGAFGYGIFLAQGDGTYVKATTASASGFPLSLRLSDVDRDGFPDVIFTSRRNSDDPTTVFIHHNEGDGSTSLHGTAAVGPAWDDAMALADVDGDGWEDAIVGTLAGPVVLRNECVTPRVHAAVVPSVATEGTPMRLIAHASSTTAFGVGPLTVWYDGVLLDSHQPNLAFEFATATWDLPLLPVGQHELLIEYEDQYAGSTSTTVTVHVVPRGVRRRAVR